MSTFSTADPVVILSYARTPMGGMQGVLSDVSATDLGATAVKAAVERAGQVFAELGAVVDPGLAEPTGGQPAAHATALVEHHHPVAHPRHNAQIMRHQNDRRPEIAAQFRQDDQHAGRDHDADLAAAEDVVIGHDYPQPIVQHDQARATTLERYAVVKTPAH